MAMKYRPMSQVHRDALVTFKRLKIAHMRAYTDVTKEFQTMEHRGMVGDISEAAKWDLSLAVHGYIQASLALLNLMKKKERGNNAFTHRYLTAWRNAFHHGEPDAFKLATISGMTKHGQEEKDWPPDFYVGSVSKETRTGKVLWDSGFKEPSTVLAVPIRSIVHQHYLFMLSLCVEYWEELEEKRPKDERLLGGQDMRLISGSRTVIEEDEFWRIVDTPKPPSRII